MIDAPTLHALPAGPNSALARVASKPPDADSVTLGNSAALATPMFALAACSTASACRMSGRRRTSSDGTVRGSRAGNAMAASDTCGGTCSAG
ncbi:Uncharacterised protein [Burkholderia pseudomallei]|nr:Uncharacterised protein [Burkholderia pseudomallei]